MQPTHEFILDKVVVRRPPRPVVVSQIWYRSVPATKPGPDRPVARPGAHDVQGERQARPRRSLTRAARPGAEENAFTSDDYTAYYQVLARDRLPVALELEADRLASLRLPADEFSKEIEVIKEERRLRTDDQPTAKAFELFRAMAYPASGCIPRPSAGWPTWSA